MKLQGKLLVLGLASALVGGFVYSQIYIHKRNRRELKDIALELADLWRSRLNLTWEQTSRLSDNIIEFTIRKNEVINALVSEQIKVLELQEIQKKEYRNLRKILTPAQFEEYLKLR